MFIMGNNNLIDKDIKNSYQYNGIIHLFCISGMHISVITFIVLFLLNKISKNKIINNSITIIFLLLYSVIINISASVIRAIIFYIVLIINKKLNIKTIYLYIIFTCLVLLINPYNIYNSGFLFSYIITFYLILFNKLIKRYNNYLLKSIILSIISFLASIPILINNYFSINFLTIINNLVFIPYVTFIIFPLSVLTFIFPILDNILILLIKILENTSLFLSNIKFFSLILRYIPIYTFILYYLVITLVLYKIYKRNYIYIIIILIMLFIHTNYNHINNKTSITFLDVGQGDSILISFKFNKGNILIDTGGIINYKKDKYKNNYSITKSITIPYLNSIGIKSLDYLIITHGDFDHIGESISLINNFKVKNIVFNVGSYNNLELDLIYVLKKKNIKYYKNIEQINIYNNKLYFLNTKEYDNENDNSSVIYTKINNIKLLFTADAGIKKENDIIKKYNLKNIDILKVGHHGSSTSSSERFINQINPKTCLIQVGKNNIYKHPSQKTLDTLQNCNIYRTDLNKAIKITFKDNFYSIKTVSEI